MRSRITDSIAAYQLSNRHEPRLDRCLESISNEAQDHDLQTMPAGNMNSLARRLDALMEIEGGGTWPPRILRPQSSSSSSTSIDSPCSWWQSYHDLALSLAASGRFVDSKDGLHPIRSESYLRDKIDANRSWMASELDRVVVVDSMMQRLDDALAQHVSSESTLGCLACLMYLAHLYRWGILPVVSLAQDEKTLEIPPAISRPLKVLNETFGLATSGGCE